MTRTRFDPTDRPQAAAVRVLLVDDQPLLRTGFRMILEAEHDMSVVGEAGDGEQAIEQVRALQPDVVLMDIRMPRMDGVEATWRISGSGRADSARVLVLTTFDLDEYVVEALRAGASGFLLKDVPADDLVAAIRVVAAGEAIVAPSIARRLLDRFASRLPAANAPTPVALASLTERETEVLRLVARGMSNGEIRRRTGRQRDDSQDPRRPRPDQARATRPGPSGGLRVRDGLGTTGDPLGATNPSPGGFRSPGPSRGRVVRHTAGRIRSLGRGPYAPQRAVLPYGGVRS